MTTQEELIEQLNSFVIKPSIVNEICINFVIPTILTVRGYYNT